MCNKSPQRQLKLGYPAAIYVMSTREALTFRVPGNASIEVKVDEMEIVAD